MTLSRKIIVRKPTLQTTNKVFFFNSANFEEKKTAFHLRNTPIKNFADKRFLVPTIFLNIMLHAPMGRFRFKFELTLFTRFTLVPFN